MFSYVYLDVVILCGCFSSTDERRTYGVPLIPIVVTD
jgi:hypothetical protein